LLVKKIVSNIQFVAVMLLGIAALVPFYPAVASSQQSSSQSGVVLPPGSSSSIRALEGMTFTISLQQALHPGYEWLCDNYDQQYVSLLNEDHAAPADGTIGTTYKESIFLALNAGKTFISCGYYGMGSSGIPGDLIASHRVQVRILKSLIPHVGIPTDVGKIQMDVQPSLTNAAGTLVVVSGEFRASNYTVSHHGHRIIGKKVLVWGNVNQSGSVGAMVITPWEFTEDIGSLEPGSYTVELFLNGQSVADTEFMLPN